ncbi:hypothetical protein BHE74_00004581, partial [Ensete ventricosum]
DDAVASALKELIKKRSYLDENLRLTDNLKVVEEDMYILTSSFLSLLAEYDIRPPVISSSAISYGIKQLYQSMHWKIRYNDNFGDVNPLLGNQPDILMVNKNLQQPTFHNTNCLMLTSYYRESVIPELRLYDQHPMDLHGTSAPNQLRVSQDFAKIDKKDVNVTLNSEMPYPAAYEKPRDLSSEFHKLVQVLLSTTLLIYFLSAVWFLDTF